MLKAVIAKMKVPIILSAALLQVAVAMDHWIRHAAPAESLHHSSKGSSGRRSSLGRSMTRAKSTPDLQQQRQPGDFFFEEARQQSGSGPSSGRFENLGGSDRGTRERAQTMSLGSGRGLRSPQRGEQRSLPVGARGGDQAGVTQEAYDTLRYGGWSPASPMDGNGAGDEWHAASPGAGEEDPWRSLALAHAASPGAGQEGIEAEDEGEEQWHEALSQTTAGTAMCVWDLSNPASPTVNTPSSGGFEVTTSTTPLVADAFANADTDLSDNSVTTPPAPTQRQLDSFSDQFQHFLNEGKDGSPHDVGGTDDLPEPYHEHGALPHQPGTDVAAADEQSGDLPSPPSAGFGPPPSRKAHSPKEGGAEVQPHVTPGSLLPPIPQFLPPEPLPGSDEERLTPIYGPARGPLNGYGYYVDPVTGKKIEPSPPTWPSPIAGSLGPATRPPTLPMAQRLQESAASNTNTDDMRTSAGQPVGMTSSAESGVSVDTNHPVGMSSSATSDGTHYDNSVDTNHPGDTSLGASSIGFSRRSSSTNEFLDGLSPRADLEVDQSQGEFTVTQSHDDRVELLENPEEEEPSRLSVIAAARSFVICNVGSGVLLLPGCLKSVGWLSGLGFLAVASVSLTAALLAYSRALMKARDMASPEIELLRMEDLARWSLGNSMASFISIIFYATIFIVAVVYMVLLGDLTSNMVDLPGPLGNFDIATQKIFWRLGYSVLLLGLVMQKDFTAYVKYGGLIGTCMLGLLIISIVAASTEEIVKDHNGTNDAPDVQLYIFNSIQDFLGVFSTIVFSYGSILMVPSIQQKMTKPEKIGQAIVWSQVATTAIYVLLMFTSYFAFGQAVADDILDSMSNEKWEWYLGHIASICNAFVMFPILLSALNEFLEARAQDKTELAMTPPRQSRDHSPAERHPGRRESLTESLLESGHLVQPSGQSNVGSGAGSISGEQLGAPYSGEQLGARIQNDIPSQLPHGQYGSYGNREQLQPLEVFPAEGPPDGSNHVRLHVGSIFESDTRSQVQRLSCWDKLWMAPYRCGGFRAQRLIVFLIAVGTSITPISFFKELVQLIPAVTLTLLALIMPVILARNVENYERITHYLPMGGQQPAARSWKKNLWHGLVITIGVRFLFRDSKRKL